MGGRGKHACFYTSEYIKTTRDKIKTNQMDLIKTTNKLVSRRHWVTLNEGKTLVNTKGVYGSKFGNETHFLSFAAIVATRNGTEGSNFHV